MSLLQLSLATLPNLKIRRPNIFFNITSPTPGTFIIALHYKGRERAILEMDLKIDDLLEKVRAVLPSILISLLTRIKFKATRQQAFARLGIRSAKCAESPGTAKESICEALRSRFVMSGVYSLSLLANHIEPPISPLCCCYPVFLFVRYRSFPFRIYNGHLLSRLLSHAHCSIFFWA